jgi:hypothetical protein
VRATNGRQATGNPTSGFPTATAGSPPSSTRGDFKPVSGSHPSASASAPAFPRRTPLGWCATSRTTPLRWSQLGTIGAARFSPWMERTPPLDSGCSTSPVGPCTNGATTASDSTTCGGRSQRVRTMAGSRPRRLAGSGWGPATGPAGRHSCCRCAPPALRRVRGCMRIGPDSGRLGGDQTRHAPPHCAASIIGGVAHRSRALTVAPPLRR